MLPSKSAAENAVLKHCAMTLQPPTLLSMTLHTSSSETQEVKLPNMCYENAHHNSHESTRKADNLCQQGQAMYKKSKVFDYTDKVTSCLSLSPNSGLMYYT